MPDRDAEEESGQKRVNAEKELDAVVDHEQLARLVAASYSPASPPTTTAQGFAPSSLKKSSTPVMLIAVVILAAIIGGSLGAYLMLGSKSGPADQTTTKPDQKKTGDGPNTTEPKSTKAEMISITGGTFQM